MHHQLPHYNHGKIALAFVFSAPGSREDECNRPAAGKTGENLEAALEHLVRFRPQLFESADRYAYRITNAHTAPLARSRGDMRSEAKITQILERGNVERVIKELEGCRHVVLCGRRAQLLAPHINQPNRQIIKVFHTSHQALVARHNTPSAKRGATPDRRHALRVLAWAEALLTQLDEDQRPST
jgi:uracil-DNA glycosylase